MAAVLLELIIMMIGEYPVWCLVIIDTQCKGRAGYVYMHVERRICLFIYLFIIYLFIYLLFSGYMNRFKNSGRSKGQLVYLISTQWFNSWRIYTQFEVLQSIIMINND